MKVTVCSNCKRNTIGKRYSTNTDICFTCFQDKFETISVENIEATKCVECNAEWGYSHIMPPYYDTNKHTYYCGCRGWD